MHLNRKHCIKMGDIACLPCRKRGHINSVVKDRKISHYHCPECANTINQKGNFIKHVDSHHNAKSKSINTKSTTVSGK